MKCITKNYVMKITFTKALIGGLIIGAIVVLFMRAKKKNKQPQISSHNK